MPTKTKPARTFKTVTIESNYSSMGEMSAEIFGESPLIMSRFTEKAEREMEAKYTGTKTKARAPKNPEQEFLDALYVIGRRPSKVEDLKKTKFAFPAIWAKKALVDAAKFSDFAMKDVKRIIFVFADTPDQLVKLEVQGPPVMRRDPARNRGGGMDLRYRPEFAEWKAKLRISYNARIITAEQVTALLMDSGFGGWGEWRPNSRESTGTNGMFRVGKVTAKIPSFVEKSNGKKK